MDCRRRAETTEQQAAARRAAKRYCDRRRRNCETAEQTNAQRSVVEQNVVGLLKHLNRLRLDGLQTAVVHSVVDKS